MRKLLATFTVLMLLVLPVGVATATPLGAPGPQGNNRPIKVMTRNLYLGADLLPVASASSLSDLMVKAAQVFGKLQATDFPARAKALAQEIRDADPDLIGLQEVALWRIGASGVLDGPVTPATTVVYDFLASLESELTGLGIPYSIVRVRSELDAEVPTSLGFDLRITQRSVILAKAGLPPGELILSNANSAIYTTNFSIPTVIGTFTNTRAWTSVDVTINKRTFRMINTHLESFSAFHRLAQSNELLNGPANTTIPVVLVGDLNSHPAESGSFVAYSDLIGAGFVDTWTQVNPSDPGFTCCNAENLLNPTPTFVRRIDHVLTRPGVRVVGSKIVGIDPDIRTPSGLWPSDHAGVLATLRP